jgi:DNA-binding NarL/FixJ family response regulator
MPERKRALYELESPRDDIDGSESGRGRILFADDDAMVLRSTSAALSLAGFEVRGAATASEALSIIQEQTPEALLIDIDMPGNRDLELLRMLDSERIFVPAVILTGAPSLQTAVSAVRLGVVDYISKPPEMDELFARLDMAVHHGRVVRSIEVAEALASGLSQKLDGLKQVIRQGPGARWISPANGTPDALRNLDSADRARLSPRERQVLCELAKGNSPQKVAEALELSTNTIRNHLKSIFVKLRVNSQVELLGKLATARR